MHRKDKLTNTQLSAVGIKRMDNDKDIRAMKGKNNNSEVTSKENK